MEEEKQKIVLFLFLGVLVFLLSANFAGIFDFSEKDKMTSRASSEANIYLEILEGEYCGNGVCSENENCSGCAVDCACASGYTCQDGVCVADSSSSTSTSTSSSTSSTSGGGVSATTPDYDFSLSKDSLKK